MYHPVSNIEISPIITSLNSKGGSYASVTRAKLKITESGIIYNCVIKQYGYEKSNSLKNYHYSREVCKRLIYDNFCLRKEFAQMGLRVPILFGFTYVSDYKTYNEAVEMICSKNFEDKYTNNIRLVLIEEFTGENIYNLLQSDNIEGSHKLSIIDNAINYISKVPNNIFIDSNCRNFTINERGISYVDFIPPDVTKYQKDIRMVSVFPELAHRGYFREGRRRWRSYSKNGRVSKFYFYLSNQPTKIKMGNKITSDPS